MAANINLLPAVKEEAGRIQRIMHCRAYCDTKPDAFEEFFVDDIPLHTFIQAVDSREQAKTQKHGKRKHEKIHRLRNRIDEMIYLFITKNWDKGDSELLTPDEEVRLLYKHGYKSVSLDDE